MKKLLPILFIVQIFCFASFSQEKKPTKQETIDWIASKFKAHIRKNFGVINIAGGPNTVLIRLGAEFVDFEKNSITLRISERSTSFRDTGNIVDTDVRYEKIDLVKIVDVGNYSNALIVRGKAVLCHFDEAMKPSLPCENEFQMVMETTEPGSLTRSFSILDFNAEVGLRSRFNSALQTLAEYNNAEKPKEVF